jgi:hypothetical protein
MTSALNSPSYRHSHVLCGTSGPAETCGPYPDDVSPFRPLVSTLTCTVLPSTNRIAEAGGPVPDDVSPSSSSSRHSPLLYGASGPAEAGGRVQMTSTLTRPSFQRSPVLSGASGPVEAGWTGPDDVSPGQPLVPTLEDDIGALADGLLHGVDPHTNLSAQLGKYRTICLQRGRPPGLYSTWTPAGAHHIR